MTNTDSRLSISATEHETGLSKDVLRKWETRYGFPRPIRAQDGERQYPREQVDRLRIIKRLLDGGARPSRIVALERGELERAMVSQAAASSPDRESPAIAQAIEMLRRHDQAALRNALKSRMHCDGLSHFVLDTVSALNHAVGVAWSEGKLMVHQEHVYSEVIQELLREGIGLVSQNQGTPRVLLATPAGELHTLGLMMVQTLFTLHGAKCTSLGAQVTALELVAATEAYQPDILALSFSAAFPSRRITPFLARIRHSIRDSIEIWAGGMGMTRIRVLPPHVRRFATLGEAVLALEQHRDQPGRQAPRDDPKP